MMLTDEELRKHASEFLRDNYHMSLDIPVKRNNRLRSTHGRFLLKNNKPHSIELAGYLLTYGVRETIIGVLKHECIHYAQFKQGLGHLDGDPLFEAELQKHHAPKTRTLMIGKYIEFQCDACGRKTQTRRKRVAKSPQSYRTACCGSPLTIIGEKVYDGSETN